MKNVLMIGASAADLAASVKALPKGNEDLNAERTWLRAGGEGYCAAAVFQSLNMPYTLLSSAGEGQYADFVRESLKARGITPPLKVSGITGCTYTMIDPKGNTGMMMVPGSEYSFDASELEGIDESEISWLYVSGDLFAHEGKDELLKVLKNWHGKIFLRLGEQGVMIDLLLMKALYGLHPVMHLTEAEAWTLARGQGDSLIAIVQSVTKETGNAVIVYLQNGGCLYAEGRSCISIPAPKTMNDKDLSGSGAAHASAFLAAVCAGMKPRSAGSFADLYASEVRSCEENVLPSESAGRMRRRMAEMILGKEVADPE